MTYTEKQFAHRTRFLAHLRAGNDGREVKAAITADMATGNGGAYVLPKILADAIGRAPAPAHAIPGLVARARVAGEDWSEPVENGAPAWHWLGDDADDEAPTIKTIAPPCGEVRCEFEVPRHLMHDAGFDLEAFFVARAATAFAEAEAIAFLAGSGVKRPLGLVESISIDTTPDADLATALRTMRDATPVQYRSHWLVPGVLFDRLDGLAAFAPADNHGPARLHGIPVLVEEACQRPGAGLVLLGDLAAAYRAVEVQPKGAASAVEVMLNPYARSGWVKVEVSKRVGGACRNPAAISGFQVAL